MRVYSPTSSTPAFPPVGDLVDVPAIPMPFRADYKLARGLPAKVRADLEAFAPNIVHVSAPEFLGHAAVRWAREKGVASIASVHTRFETYPAYYHLGFLEPAIIKLLTRFYNKFDRIVAPSPSMIALLRGWGVTPPMGIWSRGIDHDRFQPSRRSLEWRRSLGIADHEVAIGFLGRLVRKRGSTSLPRRWPSCGGGAYRTRFWSSARARHRIGSPRRRPTPSSRDIRPAMTWAARSHRWTSSSTPA